MPYVVFDLLRHQDRSLLNMPDGQRRELVEQLDLRQPELRVRANFTS